MHPQTAAAPIAYTKPLEFGGAALVLLLAVYFGVVGLISGMDFALGQFAKYWYFIVPLALGFGAQVGLYTHLKALAAQHGMPGKVVAATGATSTAAMVSCCAHYLANIVPMLGVAGFLTAVAEYEVQLFWVSLAFNAAGIFYVVSRVIKLHREHGT